jgi:hypothetical protein
MLYKAIAYCFPWFIQVKGLVKYGDKSLLHFSVYNAIDLMYVIMQLVIYLLGICLPKFFFLGANIAFISQFWCLFLSFSEV